MKFSTKIPKSLAVTVLAQVALVAGCAPATEGRDVLAAARDVAAASDVPPLPPVDGGCYAGGRLVGAMSECLPAWPATRCAVARACTTRECGAGCERCEEVFRCFPRVLRDSGPEEGGLSADAAIPACDSPRFTCDRYGCEPECQTIPFPRQTGGGVG
jgi:hypothetical protein